MSQSGAPIEQPVGSSMPLTGLRVQSALLCSDLHLSDDTPEITEKFLNWLDHELRDPPEALLILGDLFDAWIGDDLLDSPECPRCAQAVIASLSAITQRGVQVGIMHGNRDFLIGPHFAAMSRSILMTDPFVLELTTQKADSGAAAIQRIVLTHGDQLCTDDLPYQQFRLQVRSPEWQRSFLRLPLSQRIQTAQMLRQESEKEKSGKRAEIMDINPRAAVEFAEALQADLLLHGHTHRPGRYQLPNGTPRWVLSDWSTDRGSGIRVSSG